MRHSAHPVVLPTVALLLASSGCCGGTSPAPRCLDTAAAPSPSTEPPRLEGAAAGPIVSGLARTGRPDRQEVFALLARASELSLAANESCAGVVPEHEAPRLADWVNYNLSVLEGDQITIGAECEAAEASGEWQCDVEFHADFADSPDPWSWGVRFRMRETDRALVEDSVLCTGGG